MESSEVYYLLDGKTSLAREEKGISIYHVLPQEESEDKERGFRVFCIGQRCARPTKCVLLLGETGAGKTTFINATINHLFGVEFEHPFRLQVKEEVEDDRLETDSQTDLITAYTIYYREGMKYKYNFVLIDTPGLADTRGMQQQIEIKSSLEAFLTSDFGVDDLHYVGLVAKANTNRNHDHQKTLLADIISLLGNSVPEITHIFATFAVDKPMVDTAMKNAEVNFKSMFQFDNGVLYGSKTPSIALYRWKAMTDQYNTFIEALINAPPLSIKVLKERKLLDTCKKNLKTQIDELATSILALESEEKTLVEFEQQKDKNKGWKQEETVEETITTRVGDAGIHAHNCLSCKQSCIYPCHVRDNKKDKLASGENMNPLGAMAVAPMYMGPAGLLVGAVAGAVAGVVAAVSGAADANRHMSQTCGVEGKVGECMADGCKHPLSEHVAEQVLFVKQEKVLTNIDEEMKKLYDAAEAKISETNTKTNDVKEEIHGYRKNISHVTVELLYHAKILDELTPRDTNDYIEDVTAQLINEIRMSEPIIIPQAINQIKIVKAAIQRLVEYSTEEIRDKHELVEQMLTSP